jgi:hypothetical protein
MKTTKDPINKRIENIICFGLACLMLGFICYACNYWTNLRNFPDDSMNWFHRILFSLGIIFLVSALIYALIVKVFARKKK